MQGNWTVCVPLKYLILMPDIQEAKYFEFTVQIFPSIGAPGGGAKKLRFVHILPPIDLFLYTPFIQGYFQWRRL